MKKPIILWAIKLILSAQMLSNILGSTTEWFFPLLLLNGQTFLHHSCFCSISREERWWLAVHCSNDFGICGLWVSYTFIGGGPDHLCGKETVLQVKCHGCWDMCLYLQKETDVLSPWGKEKFELSHRIPTS